MGVGVGLGDGVGLGLGLGDGLEFWPDAAELKVPLPLHAANPRQAVNRIAIRRKGDGRSFWRIFGFLARRALCGINIQRLMC